MASGDREAGPRWGRHGLASAAAAAAEGAAVAIASSNPERVRHALTQLPEGVDGRVLDVRAEEAVQELFEGLGGFDHLVYTAGEPLTVRELGVLSLDQARQFLEIRYWGALMTSTRAPRFAQAGLSSSAQAALQHARRRA